MKCISLVQTYNISISIGFQWHIVILCVYTGDFIIINEGRSLMKHLDEI